MRAIVHPSQLPAGELLLSPKLDGEHWILDWDGVEAKCYSRNQTRSLPKMHPIIVEATWALHGVSPRKIEGELYVPQGVGSRSSFHDVGRAFYGTIDKSRLRFAAFQNHSQPQDYGFEDDCYFGSLPAFSVNAEKAWDLYLKFTALFEGVVVSSPTAGLIKIKPTLSFDLVVTAADFKTGTLGLSVANADGSFQSICCCKVPLRLQHEILPELQIMGPVKKGFTEVVPDTIVEVTACQVLPPTVKRKRYMYTPESYYVLDQNLAHSLLSPIFVRTRKDKWVSVEHCGYEQFLDPL